jgi:hypothetical protein
MFRLSRTFASFLLPVLLCGCAARITNLTPSVQTVDPLGMYPVEFAFQSQQQSLRWDTITPFVVVGEHHYPMTRVERMPNRWEGMIPVPPGTNLMHYRFKVDFEYYKLGQSLPDSASSSTYSLRIQQE